LAAHAHEIDPPKPRGAAQDSRDSASQPKEADVFNSSTRTNGEHSLADRNESIRRPPAATFGAIDVGTNSLHLLMVEISPGGDFHAIGGDKELVQIGRGGFREHKLTQKKMDEAIRTLMRFTKLARIKDIGRIRAVATSAVREARNGGEFVERVLEEVGLELHVISAEEEARLIYLGVRHAMDLGGDDNLIFDIGGGSLEFILGNSGAADVVTSVKLGASRLAETYLRGDPPSEAEFKSLREHIQTRLAPLLDLAGKRRLSRCIATSGTVRNIAEICAERRGVPDAEKNRFLSMKRSELKALFSELSAMPRENRARIPGMDLKRVDACLPALMLMNTILRAVNVDEVQCCESALREGIVVDYITRHRKHLMARATWPDPRARSVISLAERCQYRKAHAEHVAKLALELFDALAPLHHLPAMYRDLLRYAGLLHDIGYMIGHTGHHKHSYYLIRNGELRGFSSQEIEVMANIARYHRKERPKRSHYSYQHLSEEHFRPVRKLAVLLRLAEAMDRTHYGVVDSVSCTIEKDVVRIAMHADRDAELELWTTNRQAEQFEREFKRGLQVSIVTTGQTEVDRAGSQ